jgi:exoribonuclease R
MQYYNEYLTINENNSLIQGKIIKKDNKYYINNIEIINNRANINDIVFINKNEVVGIKQRDYKNIVGILYLDSKIKYGSIKDKSLYLFKPTNKDYTNFYVPYKNTGNAKKVYCNIQFKDWTVKDKFPLGTLMDIIGNIDNKDAEIEHLRNFYEIKNNNWRIDKNKQNEDIKKLDDLQKKCVDYEVFSIDPEGSVDIDDAFHYKNNDVNNSYEIGIHIASPYVFFKDDLKYILDRVSTVYIPGKKYNMLPNCYADNYISLLEGQNRYALSLIINIDNNNDITYNIKETIVKNIKNYTYENFNVKQHGDFIKFSSLFFKDDLSDSHKLVEYWMIYANKMIASHLIKSDCENIILRKHLQSGGSFGSFGSFGSLNGINNIVSNYLKLRSENSALYVIYNKDDVEQTHSKLGNSYYTHFTSPIRRAVDFYTHMVILQNLTNSSNSTNLNIHDYLDKINKFTKNCRKFDNKIKRLNFLYGIKELNTNIETYGFIINITENKITLYIPEHNLEEKVIIINDETYELYQKVNIKLWVFTSFENFFDKLKVEII